MTSNIAESYVSGLVQSYRDAFVKKQVTSPQIVVSLRVSTNWTQNEIDQFYSVINLRSMLVLITFPFSLRKVRRVLMTSLK